MRAIIRLGDSTSHGGKVISASSRMMVDGKPVALLGDACTCPIKGHGSPRIVEGEPTFMVDGKPAAFEGHKTDCGASLIPSTGMTVLDKGRAAGSSAAGATVQVKKALTAEEKPVKTTSCLDGAPKSALGVIPPQVATPAAAPAAVPTPPAAPTRRLSGTSWISEFPNSSNTSTLADGFRQSAEHFISALQSAGASVSIDTTLRPPERAYLMHYAWQIANNGLNPATVPSMQGVDIDWVHRNANGTANLATSRSEAQAMVNGYGIVYQPALNSRHTEGNAIDMTISWTGNLNTVDANGAKVPINTSPRTGSNAQLIQVGSSYGIIKLVSDPPHWSNDGH
jgi:uncharacterized Zn-binding protein involved in type VI secretion